jgi:hypothetical protein
MHLRRWYVRLGLTLIMSLGLTVGLVAIKGGLTTKVAYAAPANTTSYYESTTYYGTLQNQGCNAARGPAGVVVLDFGEPTYSGGYGTVDFGNNFDSDNAIFHAVANFVVGAWNCRSSSTNLAVAIGTSNYYGGYVPSWYSAGQAWAGVINQEQSFISSNGYQNQIGAYGADDIETEWENYSNSSSFVSGYNASSSRIFFDYGDDTPGYWSNSQVYYVAYGAADSWPLPEIYYNADATQDWAPLAAWSCTYGSAGTMQFKGTMSEYPTGNTPYQAFTDLYNALGAYGCTAGTRGTMIFSTNI